MIEWIWNFFYWRSSDCVAHTVKDDVQHFMQKRAVKKIEQAYLKYKARQNIRALLDKTVSTYASTIHSKKGAAHYGRRRRQESRYLNNAKRQKIKFD